MEKMRRARTRDGKKFDPPRVGGVVNENEWRIYGREYRRGLGFREFRSNSGSFNIYHNEIKKDIEIKIVAKKARLN